MFLWEFHYDHFDFDNWKSTMESQITFHEDAIEQSATDLKNLRKQDKWQCTPKAYDYRKEKILHKKKDSIEKIKKFKEELKIGTKYAKYNLEAIKKAKENCKLNKTRKTFDVEPLPLWTDNKPKKERTLEDPFDRHHWWCGLGCLGYGLFHCFWAFSGPG